jgi:polysaccharide biosynthesis transport protein
MEYQPTPEDIDFSKYGLILKRRWLPASAVFISVILIALIMTVLEKPIYEAQGKLLFKKRDISSTLVSEAPEKTAQLESLSQQNTPVDTEAEIIRSSPVVEQTILALNLKDKTGNLIKSDDVSKSLTIKGIKGTDILLISYKSRNPQEASDIINKLIEVYIERNILINRSETTAAREFITNQLPKTETALRKAENDLRLFDEKSKIISLPDEAKSAVQSLALLNQKIIELESNLANTTSQANELQTKIGLTSSEAMKLNSLNQSEAVQSVLKELQQVESNLVNQRTRFTENHPEIVKLKQQRAAIQDLLQARIAQVIGDRQPLSSSNLQTGSSAQTLVDSFVTSEVTKLGLESQLQALLQAQINYEERGNLLPKLEQQRRGLERQLATAKSKYEILVKRLQEVEIAENQNIGNARVVASASPPIGPLGSKKSLTLITGIIVGGLLYVVVAFVLDIIDPSIKTAKEAQKCFNYLCLGMIPLLRKKSQLLGQKGLETSIADLPVRDMPYSLESETYRILQSNLRLLKSHQPIKKIVITSSVSKEGKSTVSANLALALAQTGRKVLLVDVDFHHPMQHCIWELNNALGLTDVIVDQGKLKDAVKQVDDNLSVLPAGFTPHNSLSLIDSPQMNALVSDFDSHYDFIIFDTPPLVLVPDVLTLGKMADGILLVVRPGIVDIASAATAKLKLNQSDLKVLGIVVNGIMVGQEPDNYLRHLKDYHAATSRHILEAGSNSKKIEKNL